MAQLDIKKTSVWMNIGELVNRSHTLAGLIEVRQKTHFASACRLSAWACCA